MSEVDLGLLLELPRNEVADSGLRDLSLWDPEYAKVFLWAIEEFKDEEEKTAYNNMRALAERHGTDLGEQEEDDIVESEEEEGAIPSRWENECETGEQPLS